MACTATSRPQGRSAAALLVTLALVCAPRLAGAQQPPGASAGAAIGAAPVRALPSGLTLTRDSVQFDALTDTARLAILPGTAPSGALVAWTSSDTAVVSVDSAGLLTSRGNGVARVTATVEGESASAAVVVAQVAAGVELAPDSLRLVALGDTARLLAQARDARGVPLPEGGWAWSSSDTAVVAVSAAGVLTARANGSSAIVALRDGRADTASVVVRQVVASVALARDPLRFTALKDTLRLRVVARDGRGAPVPAALLQWTTSDASVATPDSLGLVVARGNGEARIFAGGDGLTDSALVVVRQRVARLALAPDTLRMGALGDTVRLRTLAFDAGGSPVTFGTFAWTSSDSSVVAVDGAGMARARRNGAVAVRAVRDGRSAAMRVLVRQVPASVALTPAADTIFPREARRFAAVASDSNHFRIADVVFEWTTSDARYAQVDATGLVTGVDVGSARVRATAGAAADSALATVVPPATLVVRAQPVPPSAAALSMRGARVPLLTLRLRADGAEAVRVLTLGFSLRGSDPGAALVLLKEGGSGAPAVVARAAAALRAGDSLFVPVTPDSLVVPARDSLLLTVALQLSGSPDAGTVRGSFLPRLTRSAGLRSLAADHVDQPEAAVASTPPRAAALPTNQAFALSENPVRSGSVIFNFSESPQIAGVYTLTGRRVVDLLPRMDQLRAQWDLTNDAGHAVAPGIYLVVVQVDGRVIREKLLVLRPSGAGR